MSGIPEGGMPPSEQGQGKVLEQAGADRVETRYRELRAAVLAAIDEQDFDKARELIEKLETFKKEEASPPQATETGVPEPHGGDNTDRASYELGRLQGNDSAAAHALRSYWVDSLSSKVGFSLDGVDTEEGWQLRDLLFQKGIQEWEGEKLKRTQGEEPRGLDIYPALGASLTRLDSERAWQLRESLIASQDNETLYAVAYSLRGLSSEKAWAMRQELLGKAPAHSLILSFEEILDVKALDSEQAWEIRNHLYDHYPYEQKTVLESTLQGLRSARANGLRARYRNDHPDDRFEDTPDVIARSKRPPLQPPKWVKKGIKK